MESDFPEEGLKRPGGKPVRGMAEEGDSPEDGLKRPGGKPVRKKAEKYGASGTGPQGAMESARAEGGTRKPDGAESR